MSGSRGHLLGDEALQGQAPPQGVDVADADEVAGQQRHRGAPAPARGALLQGRLRVRHAPLLHDPLGQEDDLPIEEEEARQAVPADEPELLLQPPLDPFRHGAVAPGGRLVAEPFQVALGRVSLRDLRLGEGVAQVRAEVELALLRRPAGVGDGLGAVPEQLRHLRRGLEVEVVVGPDVGEGPVHGGVAPGGHQRVLEAGSAPGRGRGRRWWRSAARRRHARAPPAPGCGRCRPSAGSAAAPRTPNPARTSRRSA